MGSELVEVVTVVEGVVETVALVADSAQEVGLETLEMVLEEVVVKVVDLGLAFA